MMCSVNIYKSVFMRFVSRVQPRNMLLFSACNSTNSTQDLQEFDALTEKYEELKKENESLVDKYKRALAETENLRKRTERQIEETKIFAIQGFCKDLLEVADILDLALRSLEKKEIKEDSLKNVHEGITMTKNSLIKVFAKHGLVQIVPEGKKFDPNFHEAVFEVPVDQADYPPGHVSQVLNVGYCLHARPLRPAKVGVVSMK